MLTVDRGLRALVPVLVVLWWQGAAQARPATPSQCRATIVSAAGSYVLAEARALGKCNDAIIAGKQVAPCPDVRAANFIAKAADKVHAAIEKACGGLDKTCGIDSPQADLPLDAIGWNLGDCSGLGDGTCGDAIKDCNGIVSCVTCVSHRAVTQAIDFFYHPPVSNSADKRLRTCLRQIGKGSVSALTSVSHGFATCWLGVSKAGTGGSFSCPNGKNLASAGKGKAKHARNVCKKCGGPGNSCGGGDDLTPVALGFPLQCPALGACGGTIQTVSDIASCADCISSVLMDRTARSSIPAFALPPMCVPVAR